MWSTRFRVLVWGQRGSGLWFKFDTVRAQVKVQGQHGVDNPFGWC